MVFLCDLISVVIPVKNMELYIEKCIESLLNSNYVDIEIIIVDFGSIDNTMNIINDYIDNNNNIYLYQDFDGDAASARNLGIKKAKGKYITFLDADDWVSADFLSILKNLLSKNNADIVNCGYKNVNSDLTFDSYRIFEEAIYDINSINIKYVMHELVNGRLNFEVWNKMYKKDFIEKNKINFNSTNGISGEDIYFNFTAIINCPKIINTKECLYNHLIRKNSLANNKDIEFTNRFITLIKLLYEYSKKYKYNLIDSISSLAISLILQDLLCDKSYEIIKRKIYTYRNDELIKLIIKKGFLSNLNNIKQKIFAFCFVFKFDNILIHYIKKEGKSC